MCNGCTGAVFKPDMSVHTHLHPGHSCTAGPLIYGSMARYCAHEALGHFTQEAGHPILCVCLACFSSHM